MGYIEDLRAVVGTRPLIVVGAVVVIEDDAGRILFQERANGTWGLPGGIMELGESLEETARREVFEETGLSVDGLTLMGLCSGPEFCFRIENGDELCAVTAVYRAKTAFGALEPHDPETRSLAFLDPDHASGVRFRGGTREYLAAFRGGGPRPHPA